MKNVFIINSYTIKDNNKIINKIKEYCINNNIDYVIEINSLNNETEVILDKYKNSKNIIYAVGGDGMINRVLNNIVNSKNILSIIPYGTGNDLYKYMKEKINKEFNKIDIVKINDRYFINTACFGIDADVANNKDLIKSKLIPKKQRYNISVINSYFRYKNRELEIDINNEKLDGLYTTVAVCNGKYYGNGFIIAPLSEINDGLLDIYIAENLSKIRMLNLILKLKKGKHETSPYIRKIRTKKINIKSKDKIKCNIDGEILEDNIFNIEIINKGIELYYNKELIEYVLGK